MANDYFQFKQFTLHQKKCAMKVGTDGVLLGAWAGEKKVTRILDIGTGSGLIALMLAQRFNTLIDAVEIDEEAACQAADNFLASKWGNQIRVYNKSFQEFAPNCELTYDLIVSNPPFFTEGQESPDPKRAMARHANNLTLDILVSLSKELLNYEGSMAMVLPINKRSQLLKILIPNDMWVLREAFVRPNRTEEPNRLLIEFGPDSNTTVKRDYLTIEMDKRHQYHPSFQKLTEQFYLG